METNADIENESPARNWIWNMEQKYLTHNYLGYQRTIFMGAIIPGYHWAGNYSWISLGVQLFQDWKRRKTAIILMLVGDLFKYLMPFIELPVHSK